jgi:hypothetical protein
MRRKPGFGSCNKTGNDYSKIRTMQDHDFDA